MSQPGDSVGPGERAADVGRDLLAEGRAPQAPANAADRHDADRAGQRDGVEDVAQGQNGKAVAVRELRMSDVVIADIGERAVAKAL